ncbi:glycosyltransferase [Frankia sp. B2]|nr:glycosyltransferase [Frankia sp. B2]
MEVDLGEEFLAAELGEQRRDSSAAASVMPPREYAADRIAPRNGAVDGAPVPEARNESLPSPPSDRLVYAYLGRQRRWVLLCMTASFTLASFSLVKFALLASALWVFLLLLGLNAICSAFTIVATQHRRRVTRQSHEGLVSGWRPIYCPSVDIFLPSAGEPLPVLLNTYSHIARVRWPGQLRAYVLDDSGRPEVAAAAAAHGFSYLSRPDRGRMKKAGNIQFGFEHSRGDYIAIFDADFCPRPDYLFHLAPYLDDPSVGIVQSPQHFDTKRSMGWLQRTAGATQELFYRWVQPSRDAVGVPICVGTNAIYRRGSLRKAGGFAQIEHSEDVFTGVKLLAAGYTTRYVPVVLATGLCPADLAGFINQQYRWCSGSMALLRTRQLRHIRLDWKQRVCFWSGFLYYISTAINVFTINIPGLLMVYVYPELVRPYNFLPFLAAAWVWLVLLPATSRGRWRFEVLRVQLVYSFCHAVAILHMVRGRTASWVATGSVRKRGNPMVRGVVRTAFCWLLLTTCATWTGIGLDVWRFGWGNFWLVILFQLGHSYLSVPLLFDLSRLLVGRGDRPARSRHRARQSQPDSVVRAWTGGPPAHSAPAHSAPAHSAPVSPSHGAPPASAALRQG